jgi:plasmid stabilization system protein ParE
MPAAEDLECICQRIERDNPEAARRVARTIYDGCASLKANPNIGRASKRIDGRRELLFPPLPYIAFTRSQNTRSKFPVFFMVLKIGHRKGRTRYSITHDGSTGKSDETAPAAAVFFY